VAYIHPRQQGTEAQAFPGTYFRLVVHHWETLCVSVAESLVNATFEYAGVQIECRTYGQGPVDKLDTYVVCTLFSLLRVYLPLGNPRIK
jgi:hypothetical protein